MLHGYGSFYSVLAAVEKAINLELAGTGNAVLSSAIVPGAIAWDNCTNYCGSLMLSALRIFQTDNFPIENATTEAGHGGYTACDMVVQAIRCAPQPQAGKYAPSNDALRTAAQLTLDDQWAVYCATWTELEVLKNTSVIAEYMIRQSVQMGPEGGCVGSELAFVVGMTY